MKNASPKKTKRSSISLMLDSTYSKLDGEGGHGGDEDRERGAVSKGHHAASEGWQGLWRYCHVAGCAMIRIALGIFLVCVLGILFLSWAVIVDGWEGMGREEIA